MALSHGNMAFKMHHVMAVIVKRTFLFPLFIGVSEGLRTQPNWVHGGVSGHLIPFCTGWRIIFTLVIA
jgi:hypothetical protein